MLTLCVNIHRTKYRDPVATRIKHQGRTAHVDRGQLRTQSWRQEISSPPVTAQSALQLRTLWHKRPVSLGQPPSTHRFISRILKCYDFKKRAATQTRSLQALPHLFCWCWWRGRDEQPGSLPAAKLPCPRSCERPLPFPLPQLGTEAARSPGAASGARNRGAAAPSPGLAPCGRSGQRGLQRRPPGLPRGRGSAGCGLSGARRKGAAAARPGLPPLSRSPWELR